MQQIANDPCHRQAIKRITPAGLPYQTSHFMAGVHQGADQMRPDQARSAGHQCPHATVQSLRQIALHSLRETVDETRDLGDPLLRIGRRSASDRLRPA